MTTTWSRVLFYFIMTTTRNILGIPYISGNSLMQDVILLYTLDNKTVRETSSNVVLIDNIWDDLKTNEVGPRALKVSGDYQVELKKSKKLWFYKVKYTNPDPEDTKEFLSFDLPVPTPKAETFDLDFSEKSGDTEWSSFWKGIMRKTEESEYNSSNAITDSKRPIPETQYMEYQKSDGTFSGEIKTIDSGLWERENPYESLGGLMSSIW